MPRSLCDRHVVRDGMNKEGFSRAARVRKETGLKLDIIFIDAAYDCLR